MQQIHVTGFSVCVINISLITCATYCKYVHHYLTSPWQQYIYMYIKTPKLSKYTQPQYNTGRIIVRIVYLQSFKFRIFSSWRQYSRTKFLPPQIICFSMLKILISKHHHFVFFAFFLFHNSTWQYSHTASLISLC